MDTANIRYKPERELWKASKLMTMCKTIVFFDLETTGLFHKRNHSDQVGIVQFSANKYKIRIENNTVRFEKIDSIDLFVNPPEWIMIEPGAENVHHLSREFLADKETEDIAIQKIDDFLFSDEDVILTGYNIIKFDFDVLKQLYQRCDVYFPVDTKYFDVYEMVKDHIDFEEKESASLENVAKKLVVTPDGDKFHNSMFDTVATYNVFEKIYFEFLSQKPWAGTKKSYPYHMSSFKVSKGMNRIYVETRFGDGEFGAMYYDIPKRTWYNDPKKISCIEMIDMKEFDNACRELAEENNQCFETIKGEIKR